MWCVYACMYNITYSHGVPCHWENTAKMGLSLMRDKYYQPKLRYENIQCMDFEYPMSNIYLTQDVLCLPTFSGSFQSPKSPGLFKIV